MTRQEKIARVHEIAGALDVYDPRRMRYLRRLTPRLKKAEVWTCIDLWPDIWIPAALLAPQGHPVGFRITRAVANRVGMSGLVSWISALSPAQRFKACVHAYGVGEAHGWTTILSVAGDYLVARINAETSWTEYRLGVVYPALDALAYPDRMRIDENVRADIRTAVEAFMDEDALAWFDMLFLDTGEPIPTQDENEAENLVKML